MREAIRREEVGVSSERDADGVHVGIRIYGIGGIFRILPARVRIRLGGVCALGARASRPHSRAWAGGAHPSLLIRGLAGVSLRLNSLCAPKPRLRASPPS